jgi:precorrin-3B C17-methyltransferase
MTGRLTVIGLGPGHAGQMTPEASAALADAELLLGYAPYLARVPERPGQRREPTDNREEIARASAALMAAVAGDRVAMVSGGDPGVFAMAAAVCEAIAHGPPEWRAIDVVILPGITAMLAVAARVGAPLGADFCAISLSDNLKPWDLVRQRLAAVAQAGFVIALYNPISRARPWQLGEAFALLADLLPPETPVIFGRAADRADERIAIVPLREADPAMADMATCVIIGSAHTRIIARADRPALVYSPRSVRPSA